MDIRYDLQDYRDLFAKLKRELDRFQNDPNADNLFNTLVTAWSLSDWVLKDIVVTPGMAADLLSLTGKTQDNNRRDSTAMDPMMQICQDIADASKHAVPNRATVVVRRVSLTTGKYGSGIYGVSPHRYAISAHGSLHDTQDVSTAVVDLNDAFFTKYGLH